MLNALWQPDGAKNKKNGRVHSSHEQAFQCYCAHLVASGYKRIGHREFEQPDSDAILVLRKKSRFGTEMRKGKSGDKSNSRFTPMRGRGAITERVDR